VDFCGVSDSRSYIHGVRLRWQPNNRIMNKELKDKLYRRLRQMQANLEDGAVGVVKRDLEALINQIHFDQL